MRKFIGYETLINNFRNRCINNTLSHAHLIAGEDGIGKSKLANILAKLILNPNNSETTPRTTKTISIIMSGRVKKKAKSWMPVSVLFISEISE